MLSAGDDKNALIIGDRNPWRTGLTGLALRCLHVSKIPSLAATVNVTGDPRLSVSGNSFSAPRICLTLTALRRLSQSDRAPHPARQYVVTGLSFVEDVVYVGLGVLLAVGALALLVGAFRNTATTLFSGGFGNQVIGLLDQLLLVLLIIELLYTVQVSFREHGLLAEPFLVVALIAVIRRVLVLTAEVPKLPQAGEDVFRHALWELGLLAILILILVACLVTLQRWGKRRVQESGLDQPKAA